MRLLGGSNPVINPVSILIVAIALSIGWGIRGNYGHETGAMLPGALAAIAVCVLSGREDWRRRVAYFAFFGALGWGFGGSISYMQVISYTHSAYFEPSHEFEFLHDSPLYGFYCLFAMGFLWAAVGGASTALPASLDQKRLTDLVYSFLPLFGIWVVLFLFEWEIIQPSVIADYVSKSWHSLTASGATEIAAQAPVAATGMEPTKMSRHEDLFYWLDSDWFVCAILLTGILVFDLVERRFRGLPWLVFIAAVGSAIGVGVQYLINTLGYADQVSQAIVHVQGDTSKFSADELATNWPNFLPYVESHVGWGVGLILGILLYFAIFGRFAYGSSLYLHLAIGYFVGFLGLSVFGNLHMTPPRGDSWAGITGLLLGGWVYFIRQRLWAPLVASIVCGTIGGLGFSGSAWLKLLAMSLGHPNLISPQAIQQVQEQYQLANDPIPAADEVRQQIQQAWAHYQHANWHSFLEQTYGFINGIGVAVALAILVTRVPTLTQEEPRRRWAEVFCFFFALPILAYINLIKNLNDWVRAAHHTSPGAAPQAVPDMMKAPWFEGVNLSAWAWFTLLFGIASAGILLLAIVQKRHKIAIIPDSWLGRGELLFFLILWVFVIGNFTKALVGFHESRLLTEGIININAVLVTVLLLTCSRPTDDLVLRERPRWMLWIAGSLLVGGLIAGFAPYGETLHIRHVYTNADGKYVPAYIRDHQDIRFGEDANWRVKPNLRGTPHR